MTIETFQHCVNTEENIQPKTLWLSQPLCVNVSSNATSMNLWHCQSVTVCQLVKYLYIYSMLRYSEVWCRN